MTTSFVRSMSTSKTTSQTELRATRGHLSRATPVLVSTLGSALASAMRSAETICARAVVLPRAGQALGFILALAVAVGIQTPAVAGKRGVCAKTAKLAFKACRAEMKDDHAIALGVCLNESDAGERNDCRNEAKADKNDASEECRDQLGGRLEVCDLVGADAYDPDFDPARFVDPADIGGSVAPNPYFPLVPGTRWVWVGGDERITDTVTDETKLVEGVICRVVRDVVERDGVAVELTDDWFAQDLDGNVWYCGEIARNFETFDGDAPMSPELVDIDGSWKAGRDGARPGIIMPAEPRVGDAYREEMSLGEAEDVAEIVSITGMESVPAASCSNDCVVTRNISALEPDVEETKYYAPGIGLILELDPEEPRVELIDFMTP